VGRGAAGTARERAGTERSATSMSRQAAGDAQPARPPGGLAGRLAAGGGGASITLGVIPHPGGSEST
jgi:hypothetical protein